MTSLVRQKTDYTYEIILVDNNSTDRTATIAKTFPARIVRAREQGRANARNAGVHAAHGTILAFTEADCKVPSDWIQTIGNFFSQHLSAIGVTGGIRFAQQDKLVNRLAPVVIRIGNILLKIFLGNMTFRGTSFAIPKTVQRNVRAFSPRAAPFDDVEFGFRAGKVGQIYFHADLTVTTDDRRIRGRTLAYVWEYVTSYTNLFLLKKPGQDSWFASIRT